MNPSRRYYWIWMGLFLSSGCMAAALEVMDAGLARHEKTGIAVVCGTLELPAQGRWRVPDPFGSSGGITQIFIEPPQEWVQRQQGQRLTQAWQQDKIKQGRYRLHSVYRLLLDHALDHGGVGPATLQDLPDPNHYGVKQFEQSPYAQEFEIKTPAYALLPEVPFALTGQPLRVDQNVDPRPLAVELLPYLNDGKHWVLYTNGRAQRVDIDREWLAEHHLRVTPLQEKAAIDESQPVVAAYQIYGLQRPGHRGSVSFQVQNPQTQEVLDCVWTPTRTRADQQVIKAWANARARSWSRMVWDYDAPMLKQWASIQQDLYGADPLLDTRNRRSRNRDRQMSTFGVLGGQAALQETFQLQGLQLGQGSQAGSPVPIDQIEGVEVKSHPFKDMLGDQPGGRLPLAEVVPQDCLFVHFPQPRAVLPFLETGSGFLSHLGSLSLGRSLDYGLVDRYLARVGLTQDFLTQMLQLDMVQEFGIFMPDLFLIDGTEVTVVARVPRMQGLMPLFRMIGLGQLGQGQVIEVPIVTGEKAYWSLDQDLVFISTHRALLDQAIALRHQGGQGSLGQSDEFKYMLTQLPPTSSTRAMLYFSDPFIRRLVSPATKIAQLRRLQSRVRMNSATSAAALYRLDQQAGLPTIARLVELGYLSKDFPQDDIRLDAALLATSETYGSNARLKSLTEKPVILATAQEAQAYKQYVNAYRRYWRQFFDPVAVRLDDTPDGGLELTTFILPLLDSQLYDRIRELVPGEQGPALQIPRIDPAPIALMSLNLTDKVWGEMVGQFLRSMTALDTSFVDHLGPGLHVAIQDADPVLAFGGGDMLGMAGQLGGMGDMMMIPVMVSILTRPCALFIETQDPDGLRQFLNQEGLPSLFRAFDGWFGVDAYRVTDRDDWVLSIDFAGMAKMRFGVGVQGGYLVITNQPWSQQLTLQGTRPSPLADLSLHLEPAAAQHQLAAMFTSATDKQRQIALRGSVMLAPLVWAGSQDVTEAVIQHQHVFGFSPRHPAQGAWTLDPHGNVVSTDYGSPDKPQQPAYQEGRAGFGLLQGISPVEVSLQLENTGLRTRIYWRYTATAAAESGNQVTGP